MSVTITNSRAYVRAPGMRPRILQEILEGRHPGIVAEVIEPEGPAEDYIRVQYSPEGEKSPQGRCVNLQVSKFVAEQARYFLASARFANYLRSMSAEERRVVGFSA